MTAFRMFRVLGTTEEVDSCDCCGKTNLKSTVELMELDAEGNEASSSPVYFGVTCAARAMRREVKEIRREITAAERVKHEARMAAMRAKQDRYMAAWVAHLVARTGGMCRYDGSPDVASMIKSLGGLNMAREGFIDPQ